MMTVNDIHVYVWRNTFMEVSMIKWLGSEISACIEPEFHHSRLECFVECTH